MAGGGGANGSLVSCGREGRSRGREYRARARPNGGADRTLVSAMTER